MSRGRGGGQFPRENLARGGINGQSGVMTTRDELRQAMGEIDYSVGEIDRTSAEDAEDLAAAREALARVEAGEPPISLANRQVEMDIEAPADGSGSASA